MGGRGGDSPATRITSKITPNHMLLCSICQKEFIPNNPKQKITCGSKECRKLRKKLTDEVKAQTKLYNLSRELERKQNEFSLNKSLYRESIISYADGYNGEAYVGFAKKPLMQNANGIGFLGVKVQSVNRELIQCPHCGDWLQIINPKHAAKCFGGTLADFKSTYGFNKGTALISDVYSNKIAKQAIDGGRSRTLIGGSNKYNYKSKGARLNSSNQIENQNILGTCPEQLKDRLVNYIKRFKMMPGGASHRESFPVQTAELRYGSLNQFFTFHGLPTKTAHGRIVTYKFLDGFVYSRYSPINYDELYDLLVAKCKILQ